MTSAIASAACTGDGDNAASKDCAVGLPAVLTESGIGMLRIGAPVTRIEQACHVLMDTTLVSGKEGMPERRLTVVLGSVATTATIVQDRVWRIEVTSPRFRTHDSLGVGSRMEDLRATPARVSAGEHGLYVVRSDHCGLSFLMRGVPTAPEMRAEAIPDSATVTTVLVVGCGDMPGGAASA